MGAGYLTTQVRYEGGAPRFKSPAIQVCFTWGDTRGGSGSTFNVSVYGSEL
jgi:hypothetical protein